MLKSSVDDKSFARDQASSITKKKDSGIGDVLDGTLAPEGDRGLDGPSGTGNAEAVHTFSSSDGSRSDDIRSNAPRPLLDSDHTREGVNTSLGRGDVGLVRVA